jgi:uncharacterized membrane protein
MTTSEDEDESKDESRTRLTSYVVLAGLSTIVYALFFVTMMMVPGIEAASKLWMLGCSGVLLSAALLIGGWKYQTSSAPLLAGNLYAYIGAFLVAELALCLLQLFAVASIQAHLPKP